MKYYLYSLLFLLPIVHADELDLGADFSAGDTI